MRSNTILCLSLNNLVQDKKNDSWFFWSLLIPLELLAVYSGWPAFKKGCLSKGMSICWIIQTLRGGSLKGWVKNVLCGYFTYHFFGCDSGYTIDAKEFADNFFYKQALSRTQDSLDHGQNLWRNPLFRTLTQQYVKNSEITPKKPKYFHIPFALSLWNYLSSMMIMKKRGKRKTEATANWQQ